MSFCSKSIDFNPSEDIPSLAGRTILVTGGNIGLGKQAILEICRHQPTCVFLAARSLEKARAAVDEIQQALPDVPVASSIKLVQLDLSSIESVRMAAAVVMSETDRLDVLMLNAGIMATPAGVTVDNYEVQWGTNYVGHALLGKLLLPLMERTSEIPGADVRLVLLSSDLHERAPKEGIRWDTINNDAEKLGTWQRYGQSKLAMILWGKRVARLYPRITTVSVHPGVVRTNLMNGATGQSAPMRALSKVAHRMLTSVEDGVKNQLWASFAPEAQSGLYYLPVGISKESDLVKDPAKEEEVWQWTEKELRKYML